MTTAGVAANDASAVNATAIDASRAWNNLRRFRRYSVGVQGRLRFGASKLVPLIPAIGWRIASKAFVVFSAAKTGHDDTSSGGATLKCAGFF
jgi:hypothetical protein